MKFHLCLPIGETFTTTCRCPLTGKRSLGQYSERDRGFQGGKKVSRSSSTLMSLSDVTCFSYGSRSMLTCNAGGSSSMSQRCRRLPSKASRPLTCPGFASSVYNHIGPKFRYHGVLAVGTPLFHLHKGIVAEASCPLEVSESDCGCFRRLCQHLSPKGYGWRRP